MYSYEEWSKLTPAERSTLERTMARKVLKKFIIIAGVKVALTVGTVMVCRKLAEKYPLED